MHKQLETPALFPEGKEKCQELTDKGLRGCLESLIVLILYPGLLLYRGFVAHKIFGWLITPWLGWSSPGTLVFTGVICLIPVVLNYYGHSSASTEGKPLKGFISKVIVTSLMLLSGYLFSFWI